MILWSFDCFPTPPPPHLPPLSRPSSSAFCGLQLQFPLIFEARHSTSQWNWLHVFNARTCSRADLSGMWLLERVEGRAIIFPPCVWAPLRTLSIWGKSTYSAAKPSGRSKRSRQSFSQSLGDRRVDNGGKDPDSGRGILRRGGGREPSTNNTWWLYPSGFFRDEHSDGFWMTFGI